MEVFYLFGYTYPKVFSVCFAEGINEIGLLISFLPDLFLEYRRAGSFLILVTHLTTSVKMFIRPKHFLVESLDHLRI